MRFAALGWDCPSPGGCTGAPEGYQAASWRFPDVGCSSWCWLRHLGVVELFFALLLFAESFWDKYNVGILHVLCAMDVRHHTPHTTHHKQPHTHTHERTNNHERPQQNQYTRQHCNQCQHQSIERLYKPPMNPYVVSSCLRASLRFPCATHVSALTRGCMWVC